MIVALSSFKERRSRKYDREYLCLLERVAMLKRQHKLNVKELEEEAFS